ncbi:MAG TPA: MBL fold metallo-hydrolase [Gemmatimonadota bacterium]|jgi:phosphoribosyl 1,2-cyclic phosphodiesterase
MRLTFLGTRGEIRPRSRRHRRHSSLRISFRRRAAIVDLGADWRGQVAVLRPSAILVTHAHPDHVDGLRDGAPCPVWATAAAWRRMARWPIEDRRVVAPREPFEVQGMRFEAFPVEHSLRAPAVGYRVTAGRATIFYAPDLVAIRDPAAALAGIAAYVGDGASIVRPIVREREGRRIGHASIRDQLVWCSANGVSRMIVTHCGSQLVVGDDRRLGPRLRRMGEELGVRVEIAHDGMVARVP